MNHYAPQLLSQRAFGVMQAPMELPHQHPVILHHLQTPQEIETILHLREEIDLSVHSGADFNSLEKKETN